MSRQPVRHFFQRNSHIIATGLVATRHPRSAVLIAWLRKPRAWFVFFLILLTLIGLAMLAIGAVSYSIENHLSGMAIGGSIVGAVLIAFWVYFHRRSFVFAAALGLAIGALYLTKTDPAVNASVQHVVGITVERTKATATEIACAPTFEKIAGECIDKKTGTSMSNHH